MFGFFASPERKMRENAGNWLELADKVYHYRRDVLSAAEVTELQGETTGLRGLLKEKAGVEKLKLGIERLEEVLRRTGGAIYPKSSLVENVEFFLVAAIVILGIVMMILGVRTAKADAGEAGRDTNDGQIHLHDNAPAPAAPQASAAAADVTGFSSSAWSAPEFDLASAAELCVDLGRLVNGRDLPGLMARAATVLEAKGLVLWVSDATGLSLRPSVAHGYSEKVLQRIGSLPTDGDNVTSLAYRTLQPQVVRGSIDGHGALAVPLITGQGCVGVLAAEVQGAKPGDARFAVARIIAAQLSTLVSPAAGASSGPSTAAQG